jgi:hypothetical protein
MEQTAARAYTRFASLVLELSNGALGADETRTLRDAADARLFGDHEAELHDANADVLLLLLEETGRLGDRDLHRLRSAFQAIATVQLGRLAA